MEEKIAIRSPAAPARELFEKTQELDLVIDYLVNNAGIGQYGSFAESDEAQLMTLLNLNICALTQLTRLYLPQLIELEPPADRKGRWMHARRAHGCLAERMDGSSSKKHGAVIVEIVFARSATVRKIRQSLQDPLNSLKGT